MPGVDRCDRRWRMGPPLDPMGPVPWSQLFVSGAPPCRNAVFIAHPGIERPPVDRQAPSALTATEPSRKPARTQLIHCQPAPSPPVAGGGVPSGAGMGATVTVSGCGASRASAVASSSGGAAEAAGPRSRTKPIRRSTSQAIARSSLGPSPK